MPLFAPFAPLLTLPYSLLILYYVSTTDLINLLYILSITYKHKLYHIITLNS